MVREFRHLCLERAAHEERRRSGQHDHSDDPRLGAHLGEEPARLRETEARRLPRPLPLARVPRVGQAEEEQDERQVQQHVDEQRHAGTEDEHEPAPDGGPDQHREVAADRGETDRALQMLGTDDVVDDELEWRRPEHAGGPVDRQDHGRVPGAQCAGQEEHGPGERREHQKPLGNLDELAAVVPVREGARVHGEEQIRRPVADDGEPAEGRRVEGLEDDPVADHVLDALGRHADERPEEVAAVVAMVQRPELRADRGRRGEPAHSLVTCPRPP